VAEFYFINLKIDVVLILKLF